jgi:asparagine synthase (glutamine-hydrolysing)
MCGIAGVVGRGPRDERLARVRRMGEAIAHRGPDGDGHFVDDDVALAHRRLAIIDVVGGAQPMTSSGGRWVLVFNGEIYNFEALRRGPLAAYPYQTRSDTEVILAALERWGDDAVAHLEGMFAVAAWDTVERRLLLARDGQGIKPLYVARLEHGVAFGSEVAALRAAGLQPRVDEAALDVFLDLRFVPSPQTLFQGVTRLAPGHRIVVQADGRIGAPVPFAAAAPPIAHHLDREQVVRELRETLVDSVGRQLVADVPVGVLLSGGVDSAVVAAAARRTGPVTTFCVGYRGTHRANEFAEARQTAALLGTEHHELHLDADDALAAMPTVVRHVEEPLVTTSMFAYFLLCREVVKHRKVVLTGQGADEPWGGYGRHRVAALMPFLSPFSSLVRRLPDDVPLPGRLRRRRETLRRVREALAPDDEVGRILGLHALFPGGERDAVRPRSGHAREAVARALRFAPRGTFLERSLAWETRTSLPDNLLLLGDKLSMAVGLEVRVPLLDAPYLQRVERLPGAWRRGGPGAREGKILHKAVCAGLLPDEIVRRPKKGFPSPIDDWLRARVGDAIADLVNDPRSFTRTWLDRQAVLDLLAVHRRGDSGSLERQLFAVWMLEEWSRAFLTPNAP